MNDIIHRGETMLVSISAEDFPVTDLSDVVLTIKHGQAEQAVTSFGFYSGNKS